jgi:hypothetical protein
VKRIFLALVMALLASEASAHEWKELTGVTRLWVKRIDPSHFCIWVDYKNGRINAVILESQSLASGGSAVVARTWQTGTAGANKSREDQLNEMWGWTPDRTEVGTVSPFLSRCGSAPPK